MTSLLRRMAAAGLTMAVTTAGVLAVLAQPAQATPHRQTLSAARYEAVGCTGTDATDIAIADNTTVESTITVSDCAGNAPATGKVEVHIVHTYIGDLVVTLIAPDGSIYALHNRTGGSTDNIDATYTVNVSSEVANGAWRLRVKDAAAADTGYLNGWALDLTPPPATCTGTTGTDVTIPDNTTVNSPITISGCTGNGSTTSTVEVHIVHTFVGDVVVDLIAPDGTVRNLRYRTGGGADNIDQTFTVNLSSEARNGTWNLRVRDAASGDTGYINGWTLTL